MQPVRGSCSGRYRCRLWMCGAPRSLVTTRFVSPRSSAISLWRYDRAGNALATASMLALVAASATTPGVLVGQWRCNTCEPLRGVRPTAIAYVQDAPATVKTSSDCGSRRTYQPNPDPDPYLVRSGLL